MTVKNKKLGCVYLIGAGPGDPGLITVHASEKIKQADVLVYDYLANDAFLGWAHPSAEKIYVGKMSGRHSLPQTDIQKVLIQKARLGKQVVRLKGGDPFIFGRGGEEVNELVAAEIPFEVIPGVTAALAAAAYAGIPLSHRDHSSAITFLTGHENPEKQSLSLQFADYAKTDGTLCIYMGIGQLARIVKELIAGGMSANMPVAIIEWATLPQQRSCYATLDTIVDTQQALGIRAPAIVIIGAVVAERVRHNWFESKALFGKRIVVTRAREQAGALTKLLSEQGATVIELPFIKVEPDFDPVTLSEILAGIAVYEWIIFTSANGVKQFFDLFYRAFDDIRCLGPMRIAAVGAATAKAIQAHKLKVDFIPKRANADALADELIASEGLESLQILVVTGNQNRKSLIQKLEQQGRAIVDTLPLYKTSQADLSQSEAAASYREKGADAVLFTSTSTVKSFVEQQAALKLEAGARQPIFGSIGSLTSQSLREHNLPIAFEAEKANLQSFVTSTTAALNEQ